MDRPAGRAWCQVRRALSCALRSVATRRARGRRTRGRPAPRSRGSASAAASAHTADSSLYLTTRADSSCRTPAPPASALVTSDERPQCCISADRARKIVNFRFARFDYHAEREMVRLDACDPRSGGLTFLVLNHGSPGQLGAYRNALVTAGLAWHEVHAYAGDSLPDWRRFDGILALGGPMGVDDGRVSRWLVAEKLWVADAVRCGRPYWGVCLGAQILAWSLGAAVYRGREPEVGIRPITLTSAGVRDPVFGRLPLTLGALEWHQDTFDLPLGSVLLATSEHYPHQAYRWGPAAYGLQFHLELSPRMARKWLRVPGYKQSWIRAARHAGETSLSDLDDRAARMQHTCEQLFGGWLQRVGGR